MRLAVERPIAFTTTNSFDFSEIDNDIDLRFKIGEVFEFYNEYITFEIEDSIEGKWPITIGAEFVILLKHLPDLCLWLNSDTREVFTLRFYEQGIERDVLLNRLNGNISMTYKYFNGKTSVHEVPFDSFYSCIEELCSNTASALEFFVPYIFENKLACFWFKKIGKIMQLQGKR